MNNKTVSFLIPVYNRERYIAQTIESAISQSYTNIEIIIVDNYSTDGTWRIIQGYAQKDNRIKVFQNDSNIGPVRNWKRCIDEATGEYGKILWSDDLIDAEFIKRTLPILENNNDVGLVFTDTEMFTDEPRREEPLVVGKEKIYNTKQFIENILLRSFPTSPGCAIFRLKDLKNNLLINVPNKIESDFSMHAIGNDVLIFLLTAKNYPKFCFINETLSFFRLHKGSISYSSSEGGKRLLLYNVAKGYFVDNYIKDTRLIRRFNTNLFISLIKHRNNELNLTQISGFYSQNEMVGISYIFLIHKTLSKIYKYFVK